VGRGRRLSRLPASTSVENGELPEFLSEPLLLMDGRAKFNKLCSSCLLGQSSSTEPGDLCVVRVGTVAVVGSWRGGL
jgi:hypothetical protein